MRIDAIAADFEVVLLLRRTLNVDYMSVPCWDTLAEWGLSRAEACADMPTAEAGHAIGPLLQNP